MRGHFTHHGVIVTQPLSWLYFFLMSNLNKNSVTNSIPRVKYQDLGMPLKMICAPNGLLIVANKPVNKIDSVIRQHTNSSYSYEEFEHRSALLGNIKDIAYYSYVVNFKSKNVA